MGGVLSDWSEVGGVGAAGGEETRRQVKEWRAPG